VSGGVAVVALELGENSTRALAIGPGGELVDESYAPIMRATAGSSRPRIMRRL